MIVNLARQHHLTALMETRTAKEGLEGLLSELPGVASFSLDVPHEGRKGQGLAVLVHSTIKDRVSLWRKSPHAIWLLCDKSILGRERDVVFGVVYIPPHDNTDERATHIEDAYVSISSDLADVLDAGYIPFVGGDWNAKIGVASEFSQSEDGEIVGRFPSLSESRVLIS